jgi:hypothetical protein
MKIPYETKIMIEADWHDNKYFDLVAYRCVNTTSWLIDKYPNLIGSKEWWINNGVRVWESILQKLKYKIRTIDLETNGEIKSDVFMSLFTEL